VADINLLRWHQPEDLRARNKRVQRWRMIAVFLFLIFFILHILFNNENRKLIREKLDLNSKVDLFQNNNTQQASLLPDEVLQAQVSQVALWHLMNLLNCLGKHHVQIMMMRLPENQINITGLVGSTQALSSALDLCVAKKNNTIKTVLFNHKNKLSLLQFSLVLI